MILNISNKKIKNERRTNNLINKTGSHKEMLRLTMFFSTI